MLPTMMAVGYMTELHPIHSDEASESVAWTTLRSVDSIQPTVIRISWARYEQRGLRKK